MSRFITDLKGHIVRNVYYYRLFFINNALNSLQGYAEHVREFTVTIFGEGSFAGMNIINDGTAKLVGINDNNLMQTAVGQAFGNVNIGNIIVAVCLTFFAFTTIISWNFFGKQNVQYLFGKKATIVYSVIAIGFIFLGSCLKNDLVWELTDLFNNLMVFPNALALLFLSGGVVACIKAAKARNKDLKAQKKAQKQLDKAE